MNARKIFVLIGVMLIGCAGFGQDAEARIVNVSWTNATQDVDGTALPTTGTGALASTVIEWSTCASPGVFGTVSGTLTIAATAPGAQQNAATQNLGVGVYCFRARHLTVDGQVSNNSATVSYTVTTGRPRPPANLTLN